MCGRGTCGSSRQDSFGCSRRISCGSSRTRNCGCCRNPTVGCNRRYVPDRSVPTGMFRFWLFSRGWDPCGQLGNGDSLLYILVFRLFLRFTLALLVLPKEKPASHRLFWSKHMVFWKNTWFFGQQQPTYINKSSSTSFAGSSTTLWCFWLCSYSFWSSI